MNVFNYNLLIYKCTSYECVDILMYIGKMNSIATIRAMMTHNVTFINNHTLTTTGCTEAL